MDKLQKDLDKKEIKKVEGVKTADLPFPENLKIIDKYKHLHTAKIKRWIKRACDLCFYYM